MRIDELITELRKQGVFISVTDSQVAVKATPGSLTNEILNNIKERKAEILDFFQAINYTKKKSVILKADQKTYYELSYAQKRMYFLYEFDSASTAYNMPSVLRLSGILDKERLAKAFNGLLERHEVLRTYFELLDGVPFQKLLDKTLLDIVHMDADDETWKTVLNSFIRPFELSKAPLIRVGLISFSPQEQLLVVDMHHIISDGISSNILIKDFMALYNGEELSPLALQYKDYAVWQQSLIQQKQLVLHKDFWLKEYENEVPVLELPADFPRPLNKQYAGAKFVCELGLLESLELRKLAEQEGVTMFMLMFAAFSVLLSKLGNQEDIVIGVPAGGRDHAELEDMLGMFVNTLPIRVAPERILTFKAFLAEIKQKTLSCFEHQSYPYEEMIEELQLKRDTSRNPLFDVMFSYQHDSQPLLIIPGVVIGYTELSEVVSKFDLRLNVTDHAAGLRLEFEYATGIFKAETITRFASYFRKIIAGVLEQGFVTLGQLNILYDQERDFLLKGFNDTKTTYSREKTIADLFVEQVLKTPDQIALICAEEKLTYRELDERSSIIAHYLQQEKGLLRGDLVGLLLEREIELIPYLLGVMKAGGTYVPIDPHYPQERINGIISGSGLKLVITRGSYSNLPIIESLVDLDVISQSQLLKRYTAPFTSVAVSADIAYILYTSGSTGTPKGVMISQQSLVNYISWAVSVYGCGAETVFPVYSSISFDLTVTSMFCTLVSGGTMVLYREEPNTLMIEKVFLENRATVIKLTPSHLRAIKSGNWLGAVSSCRIRKFIIGGEELSSQVAGELYAEYGGDVELYNEYGPTEATVGCMIYKFNPEDEGAAVPIGIPAANTQVYVLDKGLNPVAPGVCGELYISGDGLALGYLHQEGLSREKFIANPFIEGARLYQTGDRAVMNSSGQLVFQGRLDDQVKIRGYRIELEEVSRHLAAYPGITAAVVLADDNKEDQQLIAYYVAGEELEVALLKSFLSAKLPGYMVPVYYMVVKEIPLTDNGKINKKVLPVPDIQIEESYQAASNEIEAKLVEIWSQVLEISMEKISVNKSFFELGGTSLKLIKLTTYINQSFQWKVSVPDLFRYPSILSIVKFITEGDAKAELYKKNIEEEVTGMQDILDFL
ncbi:amino acid adenylation domain-containing protein [Pedobacter sp. WC2423]|uniref:non-ribosomal peptide synthetase n=1 Tax=Pedobacter sp. WC2423 TaxID=3234142 RepID=UPI0034660050